MLIRCSLNLLIVGLLLRLALADLIHVPRTTETKVNETTWLNCSTDISKSVHWSHGENYVYVGGSVVEPYVSRFSIDPNVVAGTYNLIMQPVKSSDAGEYKCQDDEGHGTAASTQLIVLENDPVCLTNVNLSQFIGSNECGIEQDRIVLTCEMTFYGNVNPDMQWKKSGESNNITAGVEGKKSGNKWEYTLTMMAEDSFNNSAFTCATTRSTGEQYRCTTEPIRILPACKKNSSVLTKSVGEKVGCHLNFFGQPCSYKWFDAKNFTVSNDDTLKPEEVGKYRCEAACFLRNRPYTVNVMVIEVSPVQEAGGGQYLWILLLLVLLIIVVIVIVAIYWFMKRRKVQGKERNNESGSNQEDKTLLAKNKHSEEKKLDDVALEETTCKENGGSQQQLTTPVHKSAGSESDPIFITDEDKKQDTALANTLPTVSETSAVLNKSNVKESGKTPQQSAAAEHKEDLTKGKQFIQTEAINITQGTGIRGMTVFSNTVFVLTSDPVSLVQYEFEEKSHRIVKRWPLNYLKNPFDIASCERYNSIYIMDHDDKIQRNEVFDINPNDVVLDGRKVRKWSTGRYSGNLSVSKDPSIIVTSRKFKTVLEYQCDGNLKHTLTPPTVVEKLQSAIKLQQGKFLVAYQELGNAHAHVVSLMVFPNYTDRKCEGTIVKSFGDGLNLPREVGKMNETRYLVSTGDGRIFVLDSSGRVLLLDSDLNFTKNIFSRGLNFPVKMCFSEESARLYVAGNKVNAEQSTENKPGFLVFAER